MNIGWPEIFWIGLFFSSLTLSIVNHGKPKGTYNFWTTLIALLVEFWIVWAGGFFK